MRTDDFSFSLPEELVAQHPPARRGESRLMVLDRASGERAHARVDRLVDFIEPGTLMVFNDSRVRKARIYGEALDTGSKTEFLLLRRATGDAWEAVASKIRRQRPGRRYAFPEGMSAEIIGYSEAEDGNGPDTVIVSFFPSLTEDYLERVGHVPLPPYIRREDTREDDERYQTIYSRELGSAACPTAGLHFTEDILASLDAKGIRRANVTLHVGLGTFLPVRTENIEGHAMHEEEYSVPDLTVRRVMEAKAEGRPILAVGTTSLRTLESAWVQGEGLRAGRGSTRIFIYPGYRFNAIDALFTNFHTPKSTLLMLVSAFAERETILDAYAEAVRERYRFFSYGDAMLIR
ncbi:MAG: tRNA preQ1(34) S-adenosylmethionine ribosyltransferase-isomerase QueA [Rectinemataceae bacterium]